MKKILTLGDLRKKNVDLFNAVISAIDVYDRMNQLESVMNEDEKIKNIYFSFLYGLVHTDKNNDLKTLEGELIELYRKENLFEEGATFRTLDSSDYAKWYHSAMSDFLYQNLLCHIDTPTLFLLDTEEMLGILFSNFNGNDVIDHEINKLLFENPIFVKDMISSLSSYLDLGNNAKADISDDIDQIEQVGLNKVGIDLTAKDYSFSPVYAREIELEKMEIQLLKNNSSMILVGGPGVGKTALVEGLAYKIKNGLCCSQINQKRIIQIDAADMLANTTYRGQFEARMKNILSEVEKDPNIILFVDEIHTLIGAGTSQDSSLDFANILKPYLSSNRVCMIGATTEEEYQKYISNDEAFKRRLKKIEVKPPKEKELRLILRKVLYQYMKKEEIVMNYSFDMEEEILNILLNYTSSSNLRAHEKQCNPSLAINVLDETIAYHKYFNQKEFDVRYLMIAIANCDILLVSSRKKAIGELENLILQKKKVLS